MRRTSVCVQALNDASYDDDVLDVDGGGSPAVADRTSRTFFVEELGEAVRGVVRAAGDVAITAEQRRQRAPQQ